MLPRQRVAQPVKWIASGISLIAAIGLLIAAIASKDSSGWLLYVSAALFFTAACVSALRATGKYTD